MIKKDTHEIEILQPLHSSHVLFIPALLVIIFTTIIYAKTQMKLTKVSGGLSILSYIGYLAYMFAELGNDKY